MGLPRLQAGDPDGVQPGVPQEGPQPGSPCEVEEAVEWRDVADGGGVSVGAQWLLSWPDRGSEAPSECVQLSGVDETL